MWGQVTDRVELGCVGAGAAECSHVWLGTVHWVGLWGV